MRRIILLFVLWMCASSAFAYNEPVAVISFNPSRLGAYKTLKAVEKANLQGGVLVKEEAEMILQTKTGETITLSDEVKSTATDQLIHQCSEGVGCQAYNPGNGTGNLNSITTIAPANDEGDKRTSFSGNSIQKASNTPVLSYVIDDSQPTSEHRTNLFVNGGELQVSNNAYAGTFAPNDKENLVENLKVTVNGTENNSLQINDDFTAKESFKLGGITISEVGAGGCSSTAAKCKAYQFVDRYDDSGTVHKVLAVQVKY